MTLGFADKRFHKNQLRPYLSKARFKHSLAVADLAVTIATHWHFSNPDDAWLAGLYHDMAKELDETTLLAKAKQFGYKVSKDQWRSLPTLHAPIGALMARHECGIMNPDIWGAIAWHTTGHANMTLLEKIIYLADIVAAGKKVEQGDTLRKLTFTNLDAAIALTAKETLKHLLAKDRYICPPSLACYNAYC